MAEFMKNEENTLILDSSGGESVNDVSGYQPLSARSRDLLPEFRACLTEEMNSNLSDYDCERFLIARNCDLEKAKSLITNFYNWYNKSFEGFKIDNPSLCPRDLGYQCADTKEHIMAKILQYSFSGCDREGHPIYWEKSGQSK